MVLQRWQSVYLLVAVFAMILACILPFGAIVADGTTITKLMAADYPVLLTLNILIGIILVIDIFMYKNLRSQKMVAAVAALLCIASLITQVLILTHNEAPFALVWNGSIIATFCAFVCALMARYNMTRDEKILKSYDRLR
ncbi:MAG: DUF4293 domain-containing protein [Muribaculaceae bacterium]|nr:DUF4293 domain-containing protein [Muribaculaceae bacterium]